MSSFVIIIIVVVMHSDQTNGPGGLVVTLEAEEPFELVSSVEGYRVEARPHSRVSAESRYARRGRRVEVGHR